jgi:hypothetical protein
MITVKLVKPCSTELELLMNFYKGLAAAFDVGDRSVEVCQHNSPQPGNRGSVASLFSWNSCTLPQITRVNRIQWSYLAHIIGH